MGQIEMEIQGLGVHYLIELYGCSKEILSDAGEIEKIMSAVIKITSATEIGRVFHKFSPHGVSGVILIAESHFSIHTWPENGYAAVDLFTCNPNTNIMAGFELLKDKLKTKKSIIKEIQRGLDLKEDS